MPGPRITRINEEIRKELSVLIRNLKDPRIAEFTSVVRANTTNDLRQAKIFISVMGDKETQNNSIEGLKSAAGFIRREIGKRLNLRYTPEFIFVLDHSIEHGVHISKLLENMPELKGDKENNDSE
jgi:ribosome-binding factor A